MQSVTDTLNDAFGQSQISTIYGAGQPVSRYPRSAAALPAGPGAAVEDLCHRQHHLDRHDPDRRQHATSATNTNTTRDAQCGDQLELVPLAAFARFEQYLGAALDRAPESSFHR